MAWLYKLLASVLTSALAKLFIWVKDIIATYYKFRNRKKELSEMASEVEKLSAQIKALIKKGKEVPQELKDKLREVSKKLITDGNNTGNK